MVRRLLGLSFGYLDRIAKHVSTGDKGEKKSMGGSAFVDERPSCGRIIAQGCREVSLLTSSQQFTASSYAVLSIHPSAKKICLTPLYETSLAGVGYAKYVPSERDHSSCVWTVKGTATRGRCNSTFFKVEKEQM